MSPNPLDVSKKLLQRVNNTFVPEHAVNLLAAAWIQFQTHDWFTHLNEEKEYHFIPVPKDQKHPTGNFMRIPKTKKDPSYNASSGISQTFLNGVTTWWDLSQVYGNDFSRFPNVLRTFRNGKLIMDRKDQVPINPITRLELTGVTDNWWIGLTAMHNLFAREHNRICDFLKQHYPTMTDEDLYQKARLINSAINAKIHTVEWTPSIIQSDFMFLGMNANWNGFRPFGLPPLVGTPDNLNVTHQFPEEFVTSYRMHPMLPENIQVVPCPGSRSKAGSVSLADVSFRKSTTFVRKYGLLDTVNSLGSASQGKLTLLNYPNFLTKLQIPNIPNQINKGMYMDLAAVEILRDRERGLPRYNAYRRSLNLKPFTRIEEITPNVEFQKLLKEVYDNDIEKVDLMVGQLAEEPRPTNFGFSDTTFRVFILSASRRLMADRFFTTSYNADTYTEKGLEYIKNATMTTLLSRNFPELADKLKTVPNPFIPWDNAASQATWVGTVRKALATAAALSAPRP
jgi:hypothetical protein